DTLAKQAFGGQPAALLENLLREAGGLAGMSDRFSAAGLQDIFASWVSSGENRPIHPTDLQNIMGSDALQALAARVGFSADTILPLMAQFLPQVVDRLTPNGRIEGSLPTPDQLQSIFGDVMKSGLSSLFGRKS
ncbi:MAG TPA: YidB family protein, partial [Prosthecobacter sp.]|nr:YidB family protein [Prosthecobacter sp.]